MTFHVRFALVLLAVFCGGHSSAQNALLDTEALTGFALKNVQNLKEFPGIQMTWLGLHHGQRYRQEFCYQKSKFYAKTFVTTRIGSELVERMSWFNSYDGASYYCLRNDLLSISLGLTSKIEAGAFTADLMRNPYLTHLNQLCFQRPVPLAIPQIEDNQLFLKRLISKLTTCRIGLGGKEIRVSDGTLTRTLTLDEDDRLRKIQVSNSKDILVASWEFNDYITIDAPNHRLAIPCSVRCTDPDGSVTQEMFVDKKSVKVLEAALPKSFFQVPSSMARTIRDLDLGQDVRR